MKKDITRRKLLKGSFLATTLFTVSHFIPHFVSAAENAPPIEHPFKNPKKYSEKGSCPNCGMMLNMWARTRYEFSNSEGTHSTCSLRCMADMSQNSGEKPVNAKTALYLHPEKMVAVETTSYVIGSSANGTMTTKSKLSFASTKEAEDFVKQYGGKIAPFTTAMTMATEELSVSRPKIEMKRKKMGKIVDPTAKTRCAECGMYPARFPEHRSQIKTEDGNTKHFCSTHCLINFLSDPNHTPKSVWVSIPQEQSYEYAMGLYYLVGSDIMGPMGKEALPYRNKAVAATAAQKHGGRVVQFSELNPKVVQGN